MAVLADNLASSGFKYRGRSYESMDCQAFVEQCLEDCGLKIDLAGSNAWYRKMSWVGSPEECKSKFGKIPKGAFLFILQKDGKEPVKYQLDGIGNASHIGIKTGQGKGAIHSSKSRGGVCESDFKDKSIHGGWNRIGLWREVSYGYPFDRFLRGDKQEEKEGDKVSKAKVKGGKLQMRMTKSTSSTVIDRIPDQTVVEVLDSSGDMWWQVNYKGRVGYVMAAYLEPVDDDEGYQPGDEVILKLTYDEAVDLLAAIDKLTDQLAGKVGRG